MDKYKTMKKLYYIILLFAGLFYGIASFACTSVIISASKTASGRPLMLKNRDTGNLENRIEYFQGAIYNFIGLVNSDSEGGEVWAGTNSAGFCIMNTASYNLKDDDVPESLMDREGSLMFRALGVCATTKDFENCLDNILLKYLERKQMMPIASLLLLKVRKLIKKLIYPF